MPWTQIGFVLRAVPSAAASLLSLGSIEGSIAGSIAGPWPAPAAVPVQENAPLEPFGAVPNRVACDWLEARIRGRIDIRSLGAGDEPLDLGAFDAEEWIRLFQVAGATSVHVTATSSTGGRFWWCGPGAPLAGASRLPVEQLRAACAAAGLGFGIEWDGKNGDVDLAIAGLREMVQDRSDIQYVVVDGARLPSHAVRGPGKVADGLRGSLPVLQLFERTAQGLTWCTERVSPAAEAKLEASSYGRHFTVSVSGPDPRTFDRIEVGWQQGMTCEVTVPAKAGGAPADGVLSVLEEIGSMVRDRDRVDVLEAAGQRGGVEHSASSVRGQSGAFDANQVLSRERDTYWAPDDGHLASNGVAWIQFQLAEPIAFDQLVIEEPAYLGFRQVQYRLEAWIGEQWVIVHRGAISRGSVEARFQEMQTRRVRLSVESAAATPAISRLALFRSPPSVTIEPPGTVSLNPVRVALSARLGATVRYTIDGSEVGPSSPMYTEPLVLRETTHLRARAFDGEGAALRQAEAIIRIIGPDEWHSGVSFVRPPAPGLLVEAFEGEWRSLDQMAGRIPATRSVVLGVDAARDAPRGEHAALRYTGHLLVPRDGLYTFTTRSDDGSRLRIQGMMVVDNDGTHAMREKSGKVALRAGHHPIEITWFNARGAAGLEVRWSGPSVGRGVALSPDVLFQ